MKNIIAIFVLFFTLVSSANDAIGLLSQYDLRSYHPEKYGLKDLVFDVRINGLVEQLNTSKTYGTLNDVFITVYWMQPGQYRLEVNGFKGGFNEIKNSLKNQIKPLLRFVIPEKIIPSLRPYELLVKNQSEGFLIEGSERTKKAAVSSIEVKLDADHRLNQTKLMSPGQTLVVKYGHEKKSWSHNKWLVSSIVTSSKAGIYTNSSTVEVSYKRVEGFGFPNEITVTNKVVSNKDNEEKELSKNVAKFTFDNFRVNRNIAKNYILKR